MVNEEEKQNLLYKIRLNIGNLQNYHESTEKLTELENSTKQLNREFSKMNGEIRKINSQIHRFQTDGDLLKPTFPQSPNIPAKYLRKAFTALYSREFAILALIFIIVIPIELKFFPTTSSVLHPNLLGEVIQVSIITGLIYGAVGFFIEKHQSEHKISVGQHTYTIKNPLAATGAAILNFIFIPLAVIAGSLTSFNLSLLTVILVHVFHFYFLSHFSKTNYFQNSVNQSAMPVIQQQAQEIFEIEEAQAEQKIKSFIQKANRDLIVCRENIDDLQAKKSQIVKEFIPDAQEIVAQSVKVLESSSLPIPLQFKNNINFLYGLYDVVDSEQATTIGEANKIVMDRAIQQQQHQESMNVLQELSERVTQGFAFIAKQQQQQLEEMIQMHKDANEKMDTLHQDVQKTIKSIQENTAAVASMSKKVEAQGQRIEAQLADMKSDVRLIRTSTQTY